MPDWAYPPRNPPEVIVGVVQAFQRNWPHLKPPLFHADDVLPMLSGDDAQYNAAVVLLDAERVYYPDGAP
ncbi:hypothetical protein [Nocardia sp. NPDC004750]